MARPRVYTDEQHRMRGTRRHHGRVHPKSDEPWQCPPSQSEPPSAISDGRFHGLLGGHWDDVTSGTLWSDKPMTFRGEPAPTNTVATQRYGWRREHSHQPLLPIKPGAQDIIPMSLRSDHPVLGSGEPATVEEIALARYGLHIKDNYAGPPDENHHT